MLNQPLYNPGEINIGVLSLVRVSNPPMEYSSEQEIKCFDFFYKEKIYKYPTQTVITDCICINGVEV
jgi:hypothetical protein